MKQLEISADNGGSCDVKTLIEENVSFYEMLENLTGDSDLTNVEIFREAQGEIFTAILKTYGFDIVLSADNPKNDEPAILYAVAKPLNNDIEDDIIQLGEGFLDLNTLYMIKDNLIKISFISE